jgi:hypothetical protein
LPQLVDGNRVTATIDSTRTITRQPNLFEKLILGKHETVETITRHGQVDHPAPHSGVKARLPFHRTAPIDNTVGVSAGFGVSTAKSGEHGNVQIVQNGANIAGKLEGAGAIGGTSIRVDMHIGETTYDGGAIQTSGGTFDLSDIDF